MRGFVVTLFHLPESVQIAERAAKSAAQFGIECELRPGVWRDQALDELAKEGVAVGAFDRSWSNTESALGNFVAQYRLWKEIAASDGALILEHDAVVVSPLPDLAGQGDIITLGKPSFGILRPRKQPGFYTTFSFGDKIPGAHGYYLTPKGAALLVGRAKAAGAIPVDKFISPQKFDIREYWPWPIEAKDSFTTIQKQKGCLSKHAYRKGNYRII